jgi:hypothetical protein
MSHYTFKELTELYIIVPSYFENLIISSLSIPFLGLSRILAEVLNLTGL